MLGLKVRQELSKARKQFEIKKSNEKKKIMKKRKSAIITVISNRPPLDLDLPEAKPQKAIGKVISEVISEEVFSKMHQDFKDENSEIRGAKDPYSVDVTWEEELEPGKEKDDLPCTGEKKGRKERKMKKEKEQSNICDLCGKVYSRATGLRVHISTFHLKEKRFTCEVCCQAFGRKDSLVKHRLTHTQEKNYVCEFCSRPFSQSSNLIKHRWVYLNRPGILIVMYYMRIVFLLGLFRISGLFWYPVFGLISGYICRISGWLDIR